ncbi:MAG TPA: protein kinase [Ktedonobacteraceae bacterium]|nr:protein kinase [Ktedonobacteraceae bacterium]
MSTEPLRRLGKYELQQRLGQGGMAEVWKARDTQLQRFVAIKLLHANLQADPNFVTRFQNEAQAIASLRHPNIVQIHDFQVSLPPESPSPTPYMVMAYIEGPTLADYIASTSARGKIPSSVEIVNLFTSISLAVDYAHQKGMIHRDIKPANILLDKHNAARNPMGEPILTDFGLAKLLGVSAGTLTATQLGTPLYTSPEQARGYPGNERSDLYALGIILYEMVTGAPPFRGDTPLAVLSQHLNVTPTSPVLLNPNIPPALTMVIMTALAKDPNARFPRAVTMTAAIAEALNVPLPESLGQPAYPPDVRSMPTYIGSPTYQIGTGILPTSSSPALSPSSGGMLPVTVPPGSSGTAFPAFVTPQSASQPSATTPNFWQPNTVPAPGGIVPSGPQSVTHSSPAGAVQIPVNPTPPPGSATPGPSAHPGRRWKRLYTVLVALVILALLGAGLGAYFTFFHKNSQSVVVPVPGGQAFFLSSSQFDFGTAQGIADELQIDLHNVPVPQAGKSYYAWLLADKQPHVEQNPLQPQPQFTLPLLLGKLPYVQGNISYFYPGDSQHDNLLSLASRLLITEENTNATPRGPTADHSTWRYYAEIPQTAYGNPPLSALDHIRHLFYKETRVDVLGLAGGLDVWLLRNTEKVLEWSISARGDYHPQVSDITDIHNQFLRILDYLDGSANVHIDVPNGSPILADPTISKVALLSVAPAQTNGTELANNPPGYVDHVLLHLNGVVKAPDATSQMRALTAQIIESLNNAKTWLQQVRGFARQLVQMNALQLSQPSTLTMLNSMLSDATYAYIGQLDPNTNQVVPGVLQVHYNIQRLATLTITQNLPSTL